MLFLFFNKINIKFFFLTKHQAPLRAISIASRATWRLRRGGCRAPRHVLYASRTCCGALGGVGRALPLAGGPPTATTVIVLIAPAPQAACYSQELGGLRWCQDSGLSP